MTVNFNPSTNLQKYAFLFLHTTWLSFSFYMHVHVFVAGVHIFGVVHAAEGAGLQRGAHQGGPCADGQRSRENTRHPHRILIVSSY